MISSLKFVKGAVAKQGFIPALTHFRISRGTVRGFNGQLALCAPIASDLDCCPNAGQFIKALEVCDETVTMHLAKNGKLVVSSGKFKSLVDCVEPASFPDIQPSGQFVNIGPEIYDALFSLEPFIAEDERRPWACGILLEAQSAFATNNIVAVECWHGAGLPFRVNLPAASVRELLGIGEAPNRLQFEANRVSFHWPDGRWMATQLLDATWPDVGPMLDAAHEPGEAVSREFWEALEQLLALCGKGDGCYLLGDRIATSPDPEIEGCSVLVACHEKGIYNAQQLMKLRAGGVQIAWSAYPKAVPFQSGKLRGIIAGKTA